MLMPLRKSKHRKSSSTKEVVTREANGMEDVKRHASDGEADSLDPASLLDTRTNAGTTDQGSAAAASDQSANSHSDHAAAAQQLHAPRALPDSPALTSSGSVPDNLLAGHGSVSGRPAAAAAAATAGATAAAVAAAASGRLTVAAAASATAATTADVTAGVGHRQTAPAPAPMQRGSVRAHSRGRPPTAPTAKPVRGLSPTDSPVGATQSPRRAARIAPRVAASHAPQAGVLVTTPHMQVQASAQGDAAPLASQSTSEGGDAHEYSQTASGAQAPSDAEASHDRRSGLSDNVGVAAATEFPLHTVSSASSAATRLRRSPNDEADAKAALKKATPWRLTKDAVSGRVYFYHKDSRDTLWKAPQEWIMHATALGFSEKGEYLGPVDVAAVASDPASSSAAVAPAAFAATTSLSPPTGQLALESTPTVVGSEPRPALRSATDAATPPKESPRTALIGAAAPPVGIRPADVTIAHSPSPEVLRSPVAIALSVLAVGHEPPLPLPRADEVGTAPMARAGVVPPVVSFDDANRQFNVALQPVAVTTVASPAPAALIFTAVPANAAPEALTPQVGFGIASPVTPSSAAAATLGPVASATPGPEAPATGAADSRAMTTRDPHATVSASPMVAPHPVRASEQQSTALERPSSFGRRSTPSSPLASADSKRTSDPASTSKGGAAHVPPKSLPRAVITPGLAEKSRPSQSPAFVPASSSPAVRKQHVASGISALTAEISPRESSMVAFKASPAGQNRSARLPLRTPVSALSRASGHSTAAVPSPSPSPFPTALATPAPAQAAVRVVSMLPESRDGVTAAAAVPVALVARVAVAMVPSPAAGSCAPASSSVASPVLKQDLGGGLSPALAPDEVVFLDGHLEGDAGLPVATATAFPTPRDNGTQVESTPHLRCSYTLSAPLLCSFGCSQHAGLGKPCRRLFARRSRWDWRPHPSLAESRQNPESHPAELG